MSKRTRRIRDPERTPGRDPPTRSRVLEHPERFWRHRLPRLGPYEVYAEPAAAGTFGLVFRVRHTEWNESLAAKCPRIGPLIGDSAATRALTGDLGATPNLGVLPRCE